LKDSSKRIVKIVYILQIHQPFIVVEFSHLLVGIAALIDYGENVAIKANISYCSASCTSCR